MIPSLQVGTYNVNGRKPAEGTELGAWLRAGEGADVVAVGFQEVVPLNAGNVMIGAGIRYSSCLDR